MRRTLEMTVVEGHPAPRSRCTSKCWRTRTSERGRSARRSWSATRRPKKRRRPAWLKRCEPRTRPPRQQPTTVHILTLPPLYAIVDEEAAPWRGTRCPRSGRRCSRRRTAHPAARQARPECAVPADYCLALAEAAHGSGTRRSSSTTASTWRSPPTCEPCTWARTTCRQRWCGGSSDLRASSASRRIRGRRSSGFDDPVDYIAVGPVYGTVTKDTGYEPVGLELVAYAASRATAPIVAIGGITLDTARAVLDAGAASVAVIGDLFRRRLLRRGWPEYLSALR